MEIERKFLCGKLPFSLAEFPHKQLSQCYISTNPVIRIRKNDTQFFLTIKGTGELCRQEFELELTQEQYNHLNKKCETSVISKKRYYIPLNTTATAELDIYENQLEGLITIEVEFITMEEAQLFIPPVWFGKEVTFDNRYKNSSLSQFGIPPELS